jgi:tetratricopeptide (TPR) repeat protein
MLFFRLLLFLMSVAPFARSDVETAETLFKSGVEAVQSQHLQVAADAFQKALLKKPGFTAARKNLATVLWFLGRHGESETEFREVLRQTPTDPVPHLYLGLAAFQRGQFINAKTHFESAGEIALNNPETHSVAVQVYLGAAGEYDRQGAPRKSLDCYQAAIRLDPDAESSYVSLAAFASAHGNNQFALDTLSTGLSRHPGSASLLLERGIIEAFESRFETAEKTFRASAEADSHSELALLALGIIRLQLGRPSEAASTFQTAAARWPTDSRPFYLYALALNREGNPIKRNEEIQSLRAALKLNGKDVNAHALLGRLLLLQGESAEAVRELETAVQLDPDNQTAWYQLSNAYRLLGREHDATRAVDQFGKAKARSKAQENELLQILRTVQPD